MKVKLAIENHEISSLISLIEFKAGLHNVINSDLNRVELIDFLFENCWMISFTNDSKDKVYGIVIIEWVDTDLKIVRIHFCMIEGGNIRQGWKIFLNKYGKCFNKIEAYIETDRPEVLNILKFLNFKIKREGNQYYGFKITEKTTTTKTIAPTSASCCPSIK